MIATLFFRCHHVDVSAAARKGWHPGPYASGPTSYLLPASKDRRTKYYLDDAPVLATLVDERRCHRTFSKMGVQGWSVSAAELLDVEGRWAGGDEVRGYLIVHLEKHESAPDIKSLTGLGMLVRPERRESQELLAAVVAPGGDDAVARVISDPRVFCLTLTDQPLESDEGSVRWPEASSTDRRVASLMALPAKSSIRVDRPAPFRAASATPSFDLSIGRWTAVVLRRRLRVRQGTPEGLGSSHIVRMRTEWSDVVLLELMQRDAVAHQLGRMREAQETTRRGRWARLEAEFRSWRTSAALTAVSDDPFEHALATLLRSELSTDVLAAGVESLLREHAQDEASRMNVNLNWILALLAVIAALSPVGTLLAAPDLSDVVRTPGFWFSALLPVVALVGGCLIWRRARPS